MATPNNNNNRTNSRVNNLNIDSDQSSLDLSLCLRRGSSDSRDSFYMDFDRGIDSDIDDVVADDQLRGVGGDDRQSYTGSDDEYDNDNGKQKRSRGRKNRTKRHRTRLNPTWSGLRSPLKNNGHPSTVDEDSALPPSPVCTTRILASPERGSIMSSSQGTSSGRLPNGKFQSQTTASVSAPLVSQSRSKNYETAHDSGRRSKYYCRNVEEHISSDVSKTDSDSVCSVLSSMYAKLLVVMGIGFPLSEVVSPHIPHSFFVGFYLYLYSASILFLIYGYSFLLPRREKTSVRLIVLRKLCLLNAFKSSGVERSPAVDPLTVSSRSTEGRKRQQRNEGGSDCGSFYLRMGAMAFGIGSMIYSGLEFGQYFELDRTSECYSVLVIITPCTQMAFIFIQLYFIFKNSKMRIYKFRNVARFGLMHMVATNICVWFYVLVQESKHEIFKLIEDSRAGDNTPNHDNTTHVHVHRTSYPMECARNSVMGQLVQDVSPFLFPCTIQYSLICAAILYVMWKNMKYHNGNPSSTTDQMTTLSTSRHNQQNVDCTHANKGLFAGIIFLVLAIISLIVFFVFIRRSELRELAIMEAHIYELALYCGNTVAAITALMQIRELRYSVNHRRVELDNILLIVAQTGVYIFAVFCVIGGQFTAKRNSTLLTLLTALTNLLQATVQTIFLLDASGRYTVTTDQVRRKPGREMITFLLVCNFAMWVIGTLETKRYNLNPVQLNFYGFWAWTIIAHVSTPLAIFFRFHSTTCLCEIWSKLYKLRVEQV